MPKLNTRSAATAILDTDIFLKDDTGSTASEKVTGALLRSEILNGLNWAVQDSTAYTLVMGDRIVSNVLGSDRVFTLPGTFNVTDNTNNIWVWNSTSDAFDITLTPASGDNLVVNGTSLSADATFTIPKGVMACIIPKVTDATWGVLTFGLIAGEGTAVNGAALELDINSLTTETTIDEAADYFAFWDADASEHKKIATGNIPGAGGSVQLGWTFDTTTTSADPGSKKFRYDNATLASVTEIYVDDIAEGGFDASVILGALKDGDIIFIQDLKIADDSALWRLTAPPTDETGWWTLSVTLEEEGATGLPSNNAKCGWLILAGTSHVQSSAKQSVTLGAAATTFAVTSSFVELTGDAGANTISTITGGHEGQTLVILCTDANVTITDTDAHTTDTVDLSAAFTSADDTTLTLIYDGTSWYELSRSVN